MTMKSEYFPPPRNSLLTLYFDCDHAREFKTYFPSETSLHEFMSQNKEGMCIICQETKYVKSYKHGWLQPEEIIKRNILSRIKRDLETRPSEK